MSINDDRVAINATTLVNSSFGNIVHIEVSGSEEGTGTGFWISDSVLSFPRRWIDPR